MPDHMRSYLDFEKPVAELDSKVDELRALAATGSAIGEEISRIEDKAAQALSDLYANLTPWQKTLVARHPQRPHLNRFHQRADHRIHAARGDRKFGEDEALMGGFGRFRGESICVIGQEKGATTESRIKHNFGMARPEGYRKAVRLMEMADRFGIAVLSIVDSAGAYPASARRSADRPEAIARSTDACLSLGVPNVRDHHRRRHVGRRHRHHDGESRADVRARHLQRDLAGGCILDPVARRNQGPGSRDQHEDHRAGHAALRRD